MGPAPPAPADAAGHALRTAWRIVAVAGALVLGGCSPGDGGGGTTAGAPAAASTTVPGIPAALDTVQAGSITACLDVPNPPFAVEEGQEVVGIDADLVRALGGRLARTAAFVDVDPSGLLAALRDRRCDLVASAVAAGTELPEGLAFTADYFTVEQSLLVRGTEQDRYGDLASLRGRRIGVVTGSAGADVARPSDAEATVVEFATPAEVLAALDAGQVDAALQDLPRNAAHAVTSGRSVVVATFPQGPTTKLALVVRDADPAFLQAVNGALARVTADDTFPSVLRRYLGTTPGGA